MKKYLTGLSLALMAMSLFITAAPAQTIYSDSLFGTIGPDNNTGTDPYTPDPLNGSSPDTVNTGGATWTAAGTWQRTEDGTGSYFASPGQGDNAYLPFTPTVGKSYVLQISFINQFQANPFSTEVGFTASNPLNSGNAGLQPATRIATVLLGDSIFGISPGAAAAANTDGNYLTESAFASSVPATALTLTINLTASGSAWLMSAVGTDAGTDTTVFTLAPVLLADGADIQYVGFDSTANTSLITNFSLTESASTVPEPSTWALIGLGVLVLFVFRRRHARASR